MAEAASALIPQIHHERQEPGSMLCAQHALNALLQGNYYDPSQLADVAKQLDQLERSQVDEATWQARGDDASSLNMDDTGYFSVSVLESALEVWGLRLVRWRSAEMQPLQVKPEDELAFVLNLESHWFTIRSFTGGYWFNLNSFLDKPSWVGPSYLGALLNAAETEGYSVFVARAAADHALGNLRSSAADECAATLPIARAVAEQSSSARSFQTSAHGLRPSQSAAAAKAPRAPGAALPARSGAQDEDADIQAALRASLADTAITSRHDAEEASSRMQSPTIVGQRRTRAGEMAGQDTMDEEEETDAHVDAIAPSRRRARGMAPATASTSAASSRGSPYILPTASGGRRRASRQHQLSDEDSTNDRRNLGLSTGGSRDNAITVPDDGDDDDVDDYDDDDDFEELGTAASSAPRSPFLNPALAAHLAGNSNNNSDDDFHSLSSDDDVLGESMISQNAAAVRQQARMPQSRTYDDEDAELQAALAASMRDAGGDGDVTGRQGDTEAASGALADEVAAASWLTDKDAQAIREAQASFGSGAAASTAEAVMARQASSSPPPADVERIARMRAEAQRKIQEEEEARIRGVDPAQSHSKGHAGDEKDAAGPDGGEDSDSSDEDEAPQMSPEEMRRARLARFGT